ncbi:MAG: hypothetical protein ACOVP4_14265 [Bacteriovoracaceae bacterium]
MNSGIRPFILVLSWLFTISAFAQMEPRTRLWPDKWLNDINKTVDRSGSQLTNVIFDQIDDFDYTFIETIDFNFKAGVKRTVFDNQDVLGTWTVNDNFRIELGHDKAEYSVPIGPTFLAPLAFKLGVGGTISVSHVRQVKSYLYHTLPRVDELGEGNVEEQVTRSRWLEFDPSSRPRLSNIWNPLIAATRIPWTKKGVDRLADGELVSYSASGFVSTGLELGIVPIKFHQDANLNLSVGAKVFLSGEFRITVLKESSRYVRVKVTKINSRGTEITAGSSARDIEVFKGFAIFGEDDLGRVKVDVTPFNFSLKRERKKQYDLGFRYDLNHPEGIEAYEDAVIGQFKRSEELSKKKNKIVEHILTRESLEKSRESGVVIGVDWFIKTTNKRRRSNLEADITLPDGEKKIFKSSTELSKTWSTVWGDGEKKDYNFITLFDQYAYEKGETNSFQLVTEGLIEDVRTSAKEINSYIRRVEKIVGDDTILPELPSHVPSLKKNKKPKKARYKRSSFYFGQFFSQNQVIKFIMTPADKAREITKKSFSKSGELSNGPKSKKFYRRWLRVQKAYLKVKKSSDMVKVLKELADMFKLYGKSIEGMRAVLFSLNGQEIDYFLTASNNSFGRIQLRGKQVTNAEKLLNLADDTINFENTVGTRLSDPKMIIKDFRTEQLKNKNLKVTFTLPENSNYVFFRVLRSSGWKRIKNIKELIFYNKNKFNAGINEWIVGPESSSTLDRALYESFSKTDHYTLQMSTSRDRFTWGRTESSRFKMIIPSTKESLVEE